MKSVLTGSDDHAATAIAFTWKLGYPNGKQNSSVQPTVSKRQGKHVNAAYAALNPFADQGPNPAKFWWAHELEISLTSVMVTWYLQDHQD